MRVWLFTVLAMVAFAANSVLTRLALAPDPAIIDAASFASLRVISGAVMLWVILGLKGSENHKAPWDWKMPLALLVYVASFSFAYLSLSAGTGALILFGTVQITMFAAAFYHGERFSTLGWLGLITALGGLVYLVAPGVSAPKPLGTALMIFAGLGWGVYSLLGRHVVDPMLATARNFGLCVPLILLAHLPFISAMNITAQGAILALSSGALASGLGYVLWYSALPELSAGRAASVQLSVPAIAALGGTLFLSEPITLRIVIASIATLGGVVLVLIQRESPKAKLENLEKTEATQS